MSEVWVVNASPVIVLAKAGYLHLLTELTDELIVPTQVAEEILAGPATDPARQVLEGGWGTRQTATGPERDLLEWGLGAGETAVLAIARQLTSASAVLDDAAARTCAQAAGVPVLGTLGVILRAKRLGIVPSAATVLRIIQVAGLHLDDRVIRLALGRLGETW